MKVKNQTKLCKGEKIIKTTKSVLQLVLVTVLMWDLELIKF